MKRIKGKDLGLSIQKLPYSIIEVIDKLTKAGYQAYIVGGSIRDMILGQQPKDFDAVTDATPVQIKQVFGKRCRIIGRRFELAHVYSGKEIIEVATFRATPQQSLKNASGMLLRDNHWGTIEDDFVRRDFSINALYYQPHKDEVLDFCGAVKDIKQRKLRLLGAGKQRIEEDPVRVLRAIRFAAKLDFEFDISLLKVLNSDLACLLQDVSPHRLYDEVQKLVTSGVLSKILPLLIKYQVWPYLFQDIQAKITPMMFKSAQNTDLRLKQGQSINPAFFYAVMLWENFNQRCAYHQKAGRIDARIQAGLDVLKRQSLRTAIPRFSEIFIREIWEMQDRLLKPKAAHIMALLKHPRFRAGFDFLSLREKTKEFNTEGMVDWWERFQLMTTDEKQDAIKHYQRQAIRKRQQDKNAKTDSQNEELTSHKRRKAKIQLEEKIEESALEPLLTDESTQRYQKAQQYKHDLRSSREYYGDIPSEKPAISRRKRVKRDLSNVVFGPINS